MNILNIDHQQYLDKWTEIDKKNNTESSSIILFQLGKDKEFIDKLKTKIKEKLRVEIHELEKKIAIRSRNALKKHIAGKHLKIKFGKHDKFGGRFLGELFIIDKEKNEENVNEWMIESRHALRYINGKKKAFNIDYYT